MSVRAEYRASAAALRVSVNAPIGQFKLVVS